MTQGGRVMIADDHPLTREGLALAARAAAPGAAIDQAGTIAEAEAAIELRGAGQYRLVLLDFMLPDSRGYSGFLQLQHRLGRVPIVMVSAKQEMKLVEAARALGASGFLYKSRALDDLAGALREVIAGKPQFPQDAGSSGLIETARARIATLSGAQMKVLLAMADGRPNKQIAGDLNLTEATVKAHLTAIFRKLGVVNRTQALLALQPLFGDGGEGASA
jgi:DNA-binding NarL/FixJ family response regulator